jgi:hypothetical protein
MFNNAKCKFSSNAVKQLTNVQEPVLVYTSNNGLISIYKAFFNYPRDGIVLVDCKKPLSEILLNKNCNKLPLDALGSA